MIFLSIVLNIIYLYDNKDLYIIKILFVLLIEIFYSLIMVLNKFTMENEFALPYEICFYEGLFSLIGNIILLIIFIKIDKNYIINTLSDNDKKDINNDLEYIYKNISKKDILIYITSVLLRFGYNLFALLTVKYFTPSHIVIFIIIGEIIFAFNNVQEWKFIVTIIIFFILLFLILVYTEIIELNFCKLQNNTKKNIINRANLELMDNSTNNTNNILDDSCCEYETSLISETIK